MISACNCRVLSDGCKFCQPQEYIRVLEDVIEEQQEYIKELEDEIQGLENSKEFLLKVNEDLEDENERLLALDESLQDLLSGCTEEEFVTYFEMSYDEHRACFEREDREILKVIYRRLRGELKNKEQSYKIKNIFFDENGFPTHVSTTTSEIFYTTDGATWEMRSEKTTD